ncbi:hypothetical protein [Flavobacterium sp. LC2016-01]|uniref:hypothetical protein n=1 Tax=Flavobacterium sp. LC2016-01 TaxID=2675876 RepID=UPI0012BB1090|nr:hypothetical protein [Flavobacterium sp. LC2016-01]MTH16540.1 hypothetical protein [Flavobacterium sp. LC2016-01]
MKHFYFKIPTAVFLISIINDSCASHCDDEEYNADQRADFNYKTDNVKSKID